MDKILLEEIKRTQILMGINPKSNFIFEQGPLALLKAAMAGGSKYVDDLIKFTIKTIEKGGTISAKQIDELCEYVKSTGKYTDEEIETLKNFLKKPKVLKKLKLNKGLYNNIDDYADDITEAESQVLSKLVSITDDEIKAIVKNQVNKELKLISKLPLEDDVETVIVNNVDTIISAGKKVGSVENIIWKPLDDFFVNQYVKSESSLVEKTVDEAYAAEMSLRMRNNPKLKEAVKKLEDSGLIKTSDDAATAEMKPITRDNQTAVSKTTETFENDVVTKEYNKVKDKVDSELTTKQKDYKETVKDWETDTTIKQESVEAKINSQPSSKAYKQIDDIIEKEKQNIPLNQEEINLKTEYDNWKNSVDGAGKSTTKFDELAEKVIIKNQGLTDLGQNFQRIGAKWYTTTGKPFMTFYETVLRPCWMWFMESIDLLWVQVRKKINSELKTNFDVISKRLDEQMTKAYTEYINSLPKVRDANTVGRISKGRTAKIKKNISRLKTDGQPIKNASEESIDAFTIDEMWTAYKQNVRNKIASEYPDEVNHFDKFVKIIEEDAGNNLTLSTREILEGGFPPPKSGTTNEGKDLVEKAFEANKKSFEEIKVTAEGTYANLKSKWKRYGERMTSYFFGGSFRKPTDIQKALIKQGFNLKSIGKQALISKFMGPMLLGLVNGLASLAIASFYGYMDWRNPYVEKYGNDPVMQKVAILFDKIFYDGILGRDPVTSYFSDLDPAWRAEFNSVFPGLLDNTVLHMLDFYQNSTESGEYDPVTAEEIKNNDSAMDDLNKKLKENIAKDATEYNTYTKDLKNNLTNSIKRRYGQEMLDFMKDKIFLLDELPKDYIVKVLEKSGDINKKLANWKDILKTDLNDIQTKLSAQEIDSGSFVAKGKSGTPYLLVVGEQYNPTLPAEELDTYFSGEEKVKYVEPNFYDLNINTQRVYKSLKDFKNNYNNL
jgi:hypothetical protein